MGDSHLLPVLTPTRLPAFTPGYVSLVRTVSSLDSPDSRFDGRQALLQNLIPELLFSLHSPGRPIVFFWIVLVCDSVVLLWSLPVRAVQLVYLCIVWEFNPSLVFDDKGKIRRWRSENQVGWRLRDWGMGCKGRLRHPLASRGPLASLTGSKVASLTGGHR